MLKKFSIKIKNKKEIFAFIFLLVLTASMTTYYNYTQKKIRDNYSEFINNIYFKKNYKAFSR